MWLDRGTATVATDLRHEVQDAVGTAYRITGELTGGGMAHVFLAEDAANGRRVVIKVLDPEYATAVSRERFQREIQVAVSLRHRHIVPVLAVGGSDSRIFYIMPFVEGESLRSLLTRERQLAVERAVAIARDVASAIDYASQHNIVHRDIKPDNILIDVEGRAVVADFGIARAIERSAEITSVTSTGLTLGTPLYMSPEQAAADRFVDGRSDIYSLACVLYEMLAGEPPFTGATPQVIIARHMQEPPRALRIARPDLSHGLQEVIEKALSKSPADRHRTAAAFSAALANPPAPAGPRAARTSRPARYMAVGALAALSLAGVVVAPRLAGVRGGPTRAAGTLDPRRLAVLEFEDQSAGQVLGHIASGLSVSLIHELSGVGGIEVISRNALRALRERGLSLDSIVALLRVGSVVEGSVQQSNDRLRVAVQLVDPRSRTPQESATIERTMGELFRLQDDVAHEVAVLLRRRIGAEVRVRAMEAGTRSSRARELAFRADRARDDVRSMLARTGRVDLASAVAELQRADSLLSLAERADPRWLTPVVSRGWVALEQAHRQSGVARVASFIRAVEHANRALARDSASVEARELRGTANYWAAARLELEDAEFSDRISRAARDLREAVARDSSRATAWGTLSLVQVAQGAMEEAARNARIALAMDSYLDDAVTIHLALISASLMSDNLTEAGEWCARGRREFPREARFVQCELTLLAEDPRRRPDPQQAWALLAQADSLEAPEQAAAAGREYLPIYRRLMVAVVLARAGVADSARALARSLRPLVVSRRGLALDMSYDEAYLHLVLGERAKAVEVLRVYLAARPAMRDLVRRHARWRPLVQDSAFVMLLR